MNNNVQGSPFDVWVPGQSGFGKANERQKILSARRTFDAYSYSSSASSTLYDWNVSMCDQPDPDNDYACNEMQLNYLTEDESDNYNYLYGSPNIIGPTNIHANFLALINPDIIGNYSSTT